MIANYVLEDTASKTLANGKF